MIAGLFYAHLKCLMSDVVISARAGTDGCDLQEPGLGSG